MSATHIHVDGIMLIVSLFFASFLVLLASSFYILNADIELKLISDVREQFEAEELQYNIDFKGRDGILTGTVANEKERQEAVKIAESVDGVRVIRNELTIIEKSSRSRNNSDASLSGISGITEDNNNSGASLSEISGITENNNNSGASSSDISGITEDDNNSGASSSEISGITEDNNNSGVSSSDISAMAQGKKEVIEESLDNIISSVSTSSDPDIDSYAVIEEKESNSEHLTEITEKPIIEEFIISFELDSTELSSKHESSLNSVIIKMMNDPLLFVEMSSSHLKSAIAIKRANLIKDFFAKQGIGKKRFDVIWDGSGSKNSVQLKLFQNK